MIRRKRPIDHQNQGYLEVTREYTIRLWVLFSLLFITLLIYAGVLYSVQAVHGAKYYELSTRRIPRSETVEASRGVITDRNGKVLVSNREVFNISFDSAELSAGADQNQAILRLIHLCEEHGVPWVDTLPITAETPYAYTLLDADATTRSRFADFLVSCGWSEKETAAEHVNPVLTDEALKDLGLTDPRPSAYTLLRLLRSYFSIDPALSMEEARKVIGVRYELAVRTIVNTSAYVFAPDVSVELISILYDGDYEGAVVSASAVRQYDTDHAAHVLGRTGALGPGQYEELKDQGYRYDDVIGIDGAEQAFESYLRGENGVRMITTDSSGKITSELYSKEPQPGNTVALTLDIEFQAAVEEILGRAVESMNAEDKEPENALTRGGAAVVVGVGTGEILALASYPSYSLSTLGQDIAALNEDKRSPMLNRSIQSTYAPGSTFKMVVAAAALENGIISPNTRIQTRGVYNYYAPSYTPKCWIYRQYGGTHGSINVSQALLHSCNYFFYDVGRQVGIDTLVEYAHHFGLGLPTGIELSGERSGVMDGPDYRASVGRLYLGGDTLQVSIGQGDSLFTPLQLANYVATLVSGGERHAAHLLKSVKSYDNASLLRLYDETAVDRVSLSPSTVEAIKSGMGELVRTGSVSGAFQQCVVTAGAKTGSAQVGSELANGVFVCFAPYDDPEIAVAVVVEKGGSGGALAPTAVEIINAYFASGSSGGSIVPEGVLLP